MQTGNLSLQQAPPLSVPGRFFLVAPLFGAGAALILLTGGGDLLISRWMPGMLALTHCLVLGFFSSVMIGALQQMLPVLAGVVISRPRLVAGIVFPLWVPGITALVIGLMHPAAWLFGAALLLLGGAVLAFLIPVAISLWGAQSHGDSVHGIRLAVFSLLITLLLGGSLVLGHLGWIPLWRPLVTDLHLSWGFIGWIAVLIMGVAWQVVPMFQITPPYPGWLRRTAAPAVLILLIVRSLAIHANGQWAVIVGTAADLLLAAALGCFAILTLVLQSRARRRIRDSHRDYWRAGMVWLLIALLCWLTGLISAKPMPYLLAAAAYLMGFAMAVITGMLLKIVSFLIWLHLQALNEGRMMAGKPGITVPMMKAVISGRSSNALFYLMLAAQAALALALFAPGVFTIPAALLWLAQFCLLGAVLGRAMLRYRHSLRQSDTG